MTACGKKCQLTSFLLGIVLMVFGCLLQMYWENILDGALKKKFIIAKSSKTYDSWLKNKVPVYCNFYFFNWTNPAELTVPGYKPEFEEIGPYVFEQNLEKIDVLFHDNGTVSYRLKRQWYFNRDLSVGRLTDRIVSINPVAAMVKFSLRHSFSISTLTRIAAPVAFHYKSVKTVDELLFTGYEDNLINLGRFSQTFFAEVRRIPYDKFGWWYPRNGSISEVYNMETGENGMRNFGTLRSYNYRENTGSFNGSCGDVYGSGGNFWPWNLTKFDKALLFSADICRTISMSFSEETLYDGLSAYKYESGPDFVDNGTLDSTSECLCNGECLPSGVFNSSACNMDTPVFISYPHFLFADRFYTDAVVGMKPEKEKHNMYIIIDPKFGIPLELQAPIQVNLLVEETMRTSIWEEEKKKTIFFPILWVDQRFKIEQKDLETIKMLAYLPAIGFIASVLAIVIGTFLILGSLMCWMSYKYQKILLGEVKMYNGNEGKVVETNDKQNSKFNYVRDSNLF